MSQSSHHARGDPNDDLGPVIIRVGIAMIIVPVVAVALRFWSRALGLGTKSSDGRKFWWDDWLALAVIPFSIAESAIFMYWTQIGLGRHADTLEPWELEVGLKLLYSVYHFYNIAVALTKLSAICFYARVFTMHNKWFRIGVWVSGFVIVGILIFSIFESLFQCTPVAKAWNSSLPGTCVDEQAAWYAHAALSMVADVFVLTLPLPMLWRLQLKLSQKALISGVFICGYGVVAISIGRLIANIHTPVGALFADITWQIVPILYWLLVEAPLSVLSICLPNIFSLVKRGVTQGPRSVLSTKYGNGYGNGSTNGSKLWGGRKGNNSYALNSRDPNLRSKKGFETLVTEGSMEGLRDAEGGWVTTVRGGTSRTSSRAGENDHSAVNDAEEGLGHIHVRKEIEIRS